MYYTIKAYDDSKVKNLEHLKTQKTAIFGYCSTYNENLKNLEVVDHRQDRRK
jgi:hypothetical protein